MDSKDFSFKEWFVDDMNYLWLVFLVIGCILLEIMARLFNG